MTEQWYYKNGSQELGPVTKRTLAQLIQSGELSPEDRVRSEGSTLWVPLRRVAGVIPHKSVSNEIKNRSDRSHENPIAPQSELRSDGKPGLWRTPVTNRKFQIAAGLILIVAVAAIAGWWSRSDPDFPHPISASAVKIPAERTNARLNVLRAPRPRVPSIPRLPEGAPILVPGLEQIIPVFSPCLSHDLNTIIFSSREKESTNYDLYIANRNRATDPFGPPRLIESCRSKEFEAYPAVSPNGLELIFVRSESNPQMLYCTRANTESDFGEPIPFEVPSMNPNEWKVGRPQFVDAHRVVYRLMGDSTAERQFMLTERSDAAGSFSASIKVPFNDPTPQYFISPNKLRAYFGWPKGISISNRGNSSSPFGLAQELLSVDITGPVAGPVWIAPKEDLIFYCSPGAGKKSSAPSKLWMIQY